MTKSLIAALFALLPGLSLAQTPPAPPTPELEALGATVMNLTREAIGLRAALIAAEREIERLKKPAPAEAPK